MVCKAATVLTTTLSIAVTMGAQEGISLLQTQAHLHTKKDLPDPKAKKQSSMSGQVNIIEGAIDFDCLNGEGKWVYMNQAPKEQGVDPFGKMKTDLDKSTTDISDFTTWQGRISARQAVKDGAHHEITHTEWGPVKNEKDCFARAKQDRWCNHFAEDTVYGGPGWKTPPVVGVWYGGSGWDTPSCTCGHIGPGTWYMRPDGSGKTVTGTAAEVPVGNRDAPGMWFCRWTKVDLMTEEALEELQNQPPPKVKKTPEEKEACAKAKADAKASRAALKALRAQLKEARAAVKALKAQVKAAKEDLAEKKAAQC